MVEIKIDGMKTYIVGMSLIMYAIGGWVAGKVDINTAIQSALLGLGMMGLRHGISKKVIELKPPKVTE